MTPCIWPSMHLLHLVHGWTCHITFIRSNKPFCFQYFLNLQWAPTSNILCPSNVFPTCIQTWLSKTQNTISFGPSFAELAAWHLADTCKFENCYEIQLNYTHQPHLKFICWSLTPVAQNVMVFGERIFTELSKLKRGYKLGPNPLWLVSSLKGKFRDR